MSRRFWHGLLVMLPVCLANSAVVAQHSAKPAGERPDFVYRSFDLKGDGAQITQKINEYASEGWGLVANATDSSGNAVGVFKRPYVTLKIEDDPLKILQVLQDNKWVVFFLREYGKTRNLDKNAITATFTSNRFKFVRLGLVQEGSIQFIRPVKDKDNRFLIDLLIENEDRVGEDMKTTSVKSNFTVRALLVLTSEGFTLVSGGLESERPNLDILPDQDYLIPVQSKYEASQAK